MILTKQIDFYNHLEIVPVNPVKYCKQSEGPAMLRPPQACWVTYKTVEMVLNWKLNKISLILWIRLVSKIFLRATIEPFSYSKFWSTLLELVYQNLALLDKPFYYDSFTDLYSEVLLGETLTWSNFTWSKLSFFTWSKVLIMNLNIFYHLIKLFHIFSLDQKF